MMFFEIHGYEDESLVSFFHDEGQGKGKSWVLGGFQGFNGSLEPWVCESFENDPLIEKHFHWMNESWLNEWKMRMLVFHRVFLIFFENFWKRYDLIFEFLKMEWWFASSVPDFGVFCEFEGFWGFWGFWAASQISWISWILRVLRLWGSSSVPDSWSWWWAASQFRENRVQNGVPKIVIF